MSSPSPVGVASGEPPLTPEQEVLAWREWLRRPAEDPLHKSAVRRLTRVGLLPRPADSRMPPSATNAPAGVAERISREPMRQRRATSISRRSGGVSVCGRDLA